MLDYISYGTKDDIDYESLMPSKDLCNLWCRNSITDEQFKKLYYNELFNLIKLNKFSGKSVCVDKITTEGCSDVHSLIRQYLKENLTRIYTEIYTEGVNAV